VSMLEDSFERLLGRQPGDRERQALFRARDALNLKDNDALWLVLMALGHYETLYAQFPALISRAATDVTEKVKATADAELKAAVARTRSELARSLAQTAHEIAEQVASTRRWRTVTWAVVITAAVFVGMGAAMYRAGRTAGIATGEREGYEKARDERAASAWANTPEGQLAYALAKAGSIHELATCEGTGWIRKRSSCIPGAQGAHISGWKLPEPTDRR
jgi:hypothetical protein